MTSIAILASGRESYRRGVILGLSMAEAMLIFFCAFVLLFSIKVNSLNAEIDRLQEQIADTQSLQPAEREGLAKLPEDWKELMIADETINALEGLGLNVPGLSTNAVAIKGVEALGAQGYTLAEITAWLEALPQFGRPLPEDWLSLRLVDEFIDRAREEGVPLDDLMVDPRLLERLNRLLGKPLTAEEILALLDRLEAQPVSGPDAEVPESKWPPMIPLREADGYTFVTRSAGLDNDFRELLRGEVVPKILETVALYGVNVVEVTGHTDDRGFGSLPLNSACLEDPVPNLDTMLLPVLKGSGPTCALVPADNVGLGMARAVAVVRELALDSRLAGLTIIPLSAAYLVGNDGRVIEEIESDDIAERRRIEIRMRKDNTQN